jgi:hypothetical protein
MVLFKKNSSLHEEKIICKLQESESKVWELFNWKTLPVLKLIMWKKNEALVDWNWQEKTEREKDCPTVTYSTKNPTWTGLKENLNYAS